MKRDCLIAVLTLVIGTSARADVWRDCAAWYMGGGDTADAFADGDMTDLRHAADTDSPTHGGTAKANAVGVSNRLETVYSAASGVAFPNQRTVYLAQRESFVDGVYKVAEMALNSRLPRQTASTRCWRAFAWTRRSPPTRAP